MNKKGGGLMRESKPWSKTKSGIKYPGSPDIQILPRRETQRKVNKLPELNDPITGA